jgi:NAD(P)-dependent dehydrogenase (short-subunit alcohol dehydrogenase family)
MTTRNSTQTVALITGANKGIGFETARQLGERGVTVLLGSRDAQKGVAAVARLKAEGLDAHLIQLDVENPSHHAGAAEFIEKSYGRLDILVNNAGALFESAVEPELCLASCLPVDLYRRSFEVNFFQVVALTQTLLPLIKKSGRGRIVNVSSIIASLSLQSDPDSPVYHVRAPAYSISKTAMNSFTIQLAYELRDTPIKVNSAHPGWVKTDIGGGDAPMQVAAGAATPVALSLLPPDGPTGGFFHFDESLPW